MTQANPMRKKHNNIVTGTGSVGIEKGTRYLRRFYTTIPTETESLDDTREKYCAPSAEVILYPDTVERAALAELMKSEAEHKPLKGNKAGLRERIREARHRSSDTYTLYGVDTCELFTAEYEIDISQDSEQPKSYISSHDTSSDIRMKNKKLSSIANFKHSLSSSMRKFAYKLNRLRID